MYRQIIVTEKIKRLAVIFLVAGVAMALGCPDSASAHVDEPAAIAYEQKAEAMAEPTPVPMRTPVPTPEPTETPVPYPEEVQSGAEGEDVEMLQERLKALGYYLSDETRGTYGDKTAVAVSEFQRQNGLQQTGAADAQTCVLLFSDRAVECVDFAELAPTVNMTFEELAGDDGLRDFPEGYPDADTYHIIVDIEHQVVMVYARDESGGYTVPVRYMLCSTGTGSRTPTGVFKMGTYRVRFSRFKRDGRYGQYWTQIKGAYYFHTFLYTRKDAASYDEETYMELGSKASHGCVRLTVPDARWIWYNVAYGTECEIREGDPDDTATAMIREQLTLADPPEERAELAAGEIPNTDNWSIGDIDIAIPYKRGSQND